MSTILGHIRNRFVLFSRFSLETHKVIAAEALVDKAVRHRLWEELGVTARVPRVITEGAAAAA